MRFTIELTGSDKAKELKERTLKPSIVAKVCNGIGKPFQVIAMGLDTVARKAQEGAIRREAARQKEIDDLKAEVERLKAKS